MAKFYTITKTNQNLAQNLFKICVIMWKEILLDVSGFWYLR